MNIVPPETQSLWRLIDFENSLSDRFIADASRRILLNDLASATTLDVPLESLRGRSVMISTSRQLPTALALALLDGIVRQIVLCTPDLSPAGVASALAEAGVDTIISDGTGPTAGLVHQVQVVGCSDRLRPTDADIERNIKTDWVLFTSGTTGHPKLVLHTNSSLTAAFGNGSGTPGHVISRPVWSAFYDIRRYGGLQILLRALSSGGSMVFSDAQEPAAHFMQRAGREGVTHLSGTPSHWRLALMSASTHSISPHYVRLGGEICDQAILDNLTAAFPSAGIIHGFASTETGVAFEVTDGLAGFPEAAIQDRSGSPQIRIDGGSLRVRSSRTASHYLNSGLPSLRDDEGFIDTGDLVERRGNRYFFRGRKGGIINVGGLKVSPEFVETVINQHPAVQVSRVSGRRNPITGAIVVAEIVTIPEGRLDPACFERIRQEVFELCRSQLKAHEVPAMIRNVPRLDIGLSGKLERRPC